MASISPQQQQLSLRHNVSGTVYVLHFEPAYKHAQHYVGWTEGDVVERVAVHLRGRGSPLVRAAVEAGVDVQLAATYQGTRYLERRLKSWHNTGRFCAICREHRNHLADR
jgi:predicted GIY-YIG superfamily endonuclease